MEPTRGGTGVLGDGSGEGKNVVPGVCFDFVDTFDGEVCTLAEFDSGFNGYDAGAGKCVGGSKLDAEPVLVLAGFRPDVGHLRTGIAVDQKGLLSVACRFPAVISVTTVWWVPEFCRDVRA